MRPRPPPRPGSTAVPAPGYSLCELRADPVAQAMVVFLLTAQDRPGDVTQGLQQGADWYVTKPYPPGGIATLVRRFLDSGPGLAAATHNGRDRPLNRERGHS